VVYAEKQDVLKVPNSALRFRPPPEMLAELGSGRPDRAQGRGAGGPRPDGPPRDPPTSDKKSVWVLRNGKPERVTVRTGVSDGTTSELVDGDVQAGDEAITDVNSTGTPSAAAAAGPGGGGMRMRF
jgi:HlyD family secretion protein